MTVLSLPLETECVPAAAPAVPVPATEALPLIHSDSLFLRHKSLLIEHNGQHYRLQITKQNKLILTK